jgi:transcriptional regulator with XRE-family HTH domain
MKTKRSSGLRMVRGASEVIQALMEDQGVNKAELARRVQKSRAYVTQSLSGDRNMTLNTFASFADALDADPVIDAQPRRRGTGRLEPRSTSAREQTRKGDGPWQSTGKATDKPAQRGVLRPRRSSE